MKGRDVHRCLDGVQGGTANGAVSGAAVGLGEVGKTIKVGRRRLERILISL